MNLICLVVDRLQTGMLGAYGNTWIHTPEIDRLASTAFVLDQAYSDDVRLDRVYRALWRGLHTLDNDSADAPAASLIERLAASGMQTTLLTDDPMVHDLPLAAAFGDRQIVEPPPVEKLAAELEATQLAHFFATATEWLAAPPKSFCLWLHTRGMAGPWDAPLEQRQQYADPEDPPSPDFFEVPQLDLADDADPDKLLGISHAYAAQVSLLDACIGALVDAIDDAGLAKKTLLVLLSARGFALGEHGRVGVDDSRIFGETNHLACLLRFPDGRGAAARSQALAEPADLPVTILDWLGPPNSGASQSGPAARGQSLLPLVDGDAQSVRDVLVAVSPTQAALRTAAWLLAMPLAEHGGGSESELYVKPSDRFEVSQVADRCPEIASTLESLLVEIIQTRQIPAVALSESLTAPID